MKKLLIGAVAVISFMMLFVSKVDAQQYSQLLPSTISPGSEGNGANNTMVRDSSGNLYIAYYASSHIYVRKSTDGGVSWQYWNGTNFATSGTETAIENSGSYSQYSPTIGVDSSGNLHVAWYGTSAASTTVNQIRYSKFNGTSWSAPVNLTTGTNAQQHPSLVVDSSSRIYVFWDGISPSSTVNAIRGIKSIDLGSTWSTAFTVFGDINMYQTFPSADVDSSGNLYVAWQGEDSSNSFYDRIKFSKSTNGGTSWSSVVTIGNVGDDADTPSIDVDEANNIHLAWIHIPSDSFDEFHDFGVRHAAYTKSVNGGTSFSAPIVLSTEDSNIENPIVSAYGTKNIYVLWDNMGTVSYNRSSDGGNAFSPALSLSSASYPNIIKGTKSVAWKGITNQSGVSTSSAGMTFYEMQLNGFFNRIDTTQNDFASYTHTNTRTTSAGDIELAPEFTEDFSGTMAKWTQNSAGSITGSIVNSQYEITGATSSTNVYWYYDNTDTANQNKVTSLDLTGKDFYVTFKTQAYDTAANQMGQVGIGLVDSSNKILAFAGHQDDQSGTISLLRLARVEDGTETTSVVASGDSTIWKIVKSGSQITISSNGVDMAVGYLLGTPVRLSIIAGAYGGYPYLNKGVIDDIEFGYLGSGTATSSSMDISSVGTAGSSKIAWNAVTPTGTSITVQTNLSLDGGSTWAGWQSTSNGGSISGISTGINISNARLMYRVNLSTTDRTLTPEVHKISVNINSKNTYTRMDTNQTDLTGGTLSNTNVSASKDSALNDSVNQVANGSFELFSSPVPDSWTLTQSATTAGNYYDVNFNWRTDGDVSYYIRTDYGSSYTSSYYVQLAQNLSLTNMDKIIFDAKTGPNNGTGGGVSQMLIDGVVKWSSTAANTQYLNTVIDVSTYSGSHTIQFKVSTSGAVAKYAQLYIDNVRVVSKTQSGTYTSSIIDISSIGTARDTEFFWNETEPTSTNANIYTSISSDAGTTWSSWAPALNHGPIVGITNGTNLSNTRFKYYAALSNASDIYKIPALNDVVVNIIPPTAPSPGTPAVNDMSNYGSGRDIQVNYNGASDETGVGSYRIYVVPSANASSFDVSTAETLASSRYISEPKNGANGAHSVTLLSTLLDSNGALITNGTVYKIFVLSLGQNGYLNALSTASGDLTLVPVTGTPSTPTAAAGPEINYTEQNSGVQVVAGLGTTTAAAGDTLELLLGGNPFTTPITRVLIGSDITAGSYTFTIASGQLGINGTKSITSRITDAGGNQSSQSAVLSLTLDTIGPVAPTASVAGGTYNVAKSVTITPPNDAVTTYYTTDGTTPTNVNTLYTGAINIDAADGVTVVLKARSYDSAGNSGSIMTVNYTFDKVGPVAPSASVVGGTYNTAKSVALTLAGDAVSTYYTLDGNVPDNTKTSYTGAISIDAADGVTVTLKAVSYDSLGNKGTVLTVNYLFDKVGPIAPTASVPGGTYNVSKSVTLTAAGDAVSTYYALDGTAPDNTKTSYTGTITINGADGVTVVLKAVSYDAAGNKGTSMSVSYVFDKVGPIAPTASVPGGTYNASQSVTLTSAGDAVSTYYTLDGTTPNNTKNAYTGAITVNGADGATVVLKAVSYDAVGNAGTVMTVSYLFDKVGPSAPTSSVSGGTYNVAKSVTLTAAGDAVSTYYTTDGTTPDNTKTAYTGAINIDGADGATVTLKAVSYDAVGNIGTVMTVNYTFDKVGPAAPTVSIPGGIYNSSRSVSLTNAGDASSTYYTLDGTIPNNTKTAYTGAITVNGADGITIELKAVSYDTYGNIGTILSASYIFDKVGPAAPNASIPGGTYNSAQSVTLISAGDAVSTYYTLDGTTPNNTKTAYSGAISIDGVNGATLTLKAVSYDAVGNTGSILTVSYVFDRTGPAAPTTNVPGGTYNTAKSVSLTSAGDASSTYYTLDGATPDNSKSLYTGAIIVDGSDGATVTLKAVSYDSMGNIGAVMVVNYVFDKSGPSAPTSNLSGGTFNSSQSVTLTSAGDAAYTYYTLDGMAPDNTKTAYTGAITINGADGATIVLKAVSYDAAGNKGSEMSESYFFDKVGPTAPTADILDGTYNSTQSVTLTSAGDAAATYYTLDGTTPNNTKTAYEEPISINGSDEDTVTLKAASFDPIGNMGSIMTILYIFDKSGPAAPSASLPSDTYNEAQSVSLTSAEDASATYYTLDGSEPDNTKNGYTGVITVDGANEAVITLKAVSYDSLGNKGQVISVDYAFDKQGPQAPTTGISGGVYNSEQNVEILEAIDAVNTYYTLDGSTPDNTKSNYSDSVNVDGSDGATITLKAISYDEYGNPSSITTLNYTFDKVGPAVPTSNLSSGTYKTAQSTTLSPDNDAVSTYYTLDGSTPNNTKTAYTGSITINGPDGAVIVLKAVSYDAAGNAGNILSETYSFDKSGPAAPTADISGGVYNSGKSVQLTASETGDIYYTTDGSTPDNSKTSYTGPISISSDTTLKAVSYDILGNIGAVMTEVYTIDTTGPNAPTVSINSGIYNNAQSVIITASEPGNVYYSLDGSTPDNTKTLYSGPITINGANGATITLKTISYDLAGNLGIPVTKTYTFDKVGPTAPTADIPGGTFNSPQSISITEAVDSQETYYTLDGSTPDNTDSLYTGAITIDGADGSTITLKAVSCDNLGNKGSILSVSYTFDKAGPASPTANVSGGLYNTAKTVSLTAGNGAVSTYYTLDGSSPNSSKNLYSGPISVDGSNGTTVVLKAVSYDSLGNLGSVMSVSYTFDKIGPSIPSVNIPGGTYSTGQNVTLTQNGDAINVYYTLDGSSPNNTKTLYSGPILIDGANGVTVTLKAASYDSAGNIGTTLTSNYLFNKNAGAVSTPTVSDISNYGDGRDLRVSFTGVSSETNVLGYRIFVVPSSSSGTFTESNASGLGSARYLTEAKNGNNGSHAVTLTQTLLDIAGNQLANGTAYKVFILTLGQNGASNVLSSGSSDITLSSSIPGVTVLSVSATAAPLVTDSSNYGDARDLSISFRSSYNESDISVYRIFVVPSSQTGSFTTSFAETLDSTKYISVSKTGARTSVNVPKNQALKDSIGNNIANGNTYMIYVLSLGQNGKTSKLSNPSKAVTLTNTSSNTTASYTVSVADIGNYNDARDVRVIFKGSSNEINVASYKIFLAPSSVTFNLSSTTAAINSGYYQAENKLGSNVLHSVSLTQAFRDITGGQVRNSISYKAYLLIQGQNGYSNTLTNSITFTLSPTSAVLTTLDAPKVEDASNKEDGSDLKVSFRGLLSEVNVKEYRIIVVPEISAGSFDVLSASGLIYPKYQKVDKSGSRGVHSVNLTNSLQDINGNIIDASTAYKIFVLAVANDSSTNNSLSLPSRSIRLSPIVPIVGTVSKVSVNDYSNYGNASDIQVKFVSALNETYITGYRIYVVPSNMASNFSLSAAEVNTNYQIENKTSPKVQHSVRLNSGLNDTAGAAVSNGKSYKMFILSVGSGNYSSNITLGSQELTLTP